MSKINEEYVIQPIATSSGVREQGEFVVVVSGNRTTSSDGERIHVAGELFWLITENGSGSEAKLVEVLARALDVQETRLRNTIRKERIARKRSTGGQS